MTAARAGEAGQDRRNGCAAVRPEQLCDRDRRNSSCSRAGGRVGRDGTRPAGDLARQSGAGTDSPAGFARTVRPGRRRRSPSWLVQAATMAGPRPPSAVRSREPAAGRTQHHHRWPLSWPPVPRASTSTVNSPPRPKAVSQSRWRTARTRTSSASPWPGSRPAAPRRTCAPWVRTRPPPVYRPTARRLDWTQVKRRVGACHCRSPPAASSYCMTRRAQNGSHGIFRPGRGEVGTGRLSRGTHHGTPARAGRLSRGAHHGPFGKMLVKSLLRIFHPFRNGRAGGHCRTKRGKEEPMEADLPAHLGLSGRCRCGRRRPFGRADGARAWPRTWTRSSERLSARK